MQFAYFLEEGIVLAPSVYFTGIWIDTQGLSACIPESGPYRFLRVLGELKAGKLEGIRNLAAYRFDQLRRGQGSTSGSRFNTVQVRVQCLGDFLLEHQDGSGEADDGDKDA